MTAGLLLAVSLAGTTIRWTFADGPAAGTTYEHTFHEDGNVTWRVVSGEHQGVSRREKSYGAARPGEQILAISYLAASGHTLTVILNLETGKMVGFASSDKEWYAMHGSFEIVNPPPR